MSSADWSMADALPLSTLIGFSGLPGLLLILLCGAVLGGWLGRLVGLGILGAIALALLIDATIIGVLVIMPLRSRRKKHREP